MPFQSWEVNFAYVEQGERLNALVKLRLCPACTVLLHKVNGKASESTARETLRPADASDNEESGDEDERAVARLLL